MFSVISEKKSREKARQLFFVLLRILGFVGIPAFLVFGIVSFLEEELLNKAKQEEIRLMEGILSRLSEMSNPKLRIERTLNYFSRIPSDSKRFPKVAARIKKRFAKCLEIFFFDSGGQPVSLPEFPAAPKYASSHFMQCLLHKDMKAKPKIIAAFAGNPNAPQLFSESPGRFVELGGGKKKTFGGWWKLREKKGRFSFHMLAFINEGEIEQSYFLNLAIRDLTHEEHGKYILGWRETSRSEPAGSKDSSLDSTVMNALRMIPVGESRTDVGGKAILTAHTERGELFFCLARDAIEKPRIFAIPKLFLAVLSLFGCVILVLASREDFSRMAGLRAKLILLFVVCGGTPLLLLMITAIIDRWDRETILIEQIRRSHIEQLTKIDEELHSQYYKYVQKYDQFLGSLKTVPDPRLRQALVPFKNWAEKQLEIVLQSLVVDNRGNLLLYDDKLRGLDKTLASNTKEVKRLYGLQILNAFNGYLDGQKSDVSGRADLKMFTESTGKYFIKTILTRGEEIGYMNIFNSLVPAYVGILLGPKNHARGLLMVIHDKRFAQISHLRNVVRKWKETDISNQSSFFAIPVNPSSKLPLFLPAALRGNPALEALCNSTVISRIPQHRIAFLGKRDFLLSALQGQNLDDFVLIVAQPLDVIRAQTKVLNFRLALISLFVLFLAVGSAWMTSFLLLKPLEALSEGLEALRNRNFKYSSETGKVSELATVAHRLNLVLEDLREMEIAKNVQEQLWPGTGLEGAGWNIEGKCITASNLGGDHHDWFLLPDNKLLIAIGDVAGHGIPSALVEASAKIFLAIHASAGLGPSAILGAMNDNFIEQIEKALAMTFWVGIFDPVNRKLTYSNAGQSYPIAVIGGDPPEMLKQPAFPLGLRAKSVYKESVLDFKQGGTLFLFSDGLVEAKNERGEMFSFQRMADLARKYGNCWPNEAIEKILKEIGDWSQRDVPEDDQTLVVLKVCPSEKTILNDKRKMSPQ